MVSEKNTETYLIGLIAVAALLLVFNQYQLFTITSAAGAVTGSAVSGSNIELTGDPVQDAVAIVIPTGTPFYGPELGVSFDDPLGSLTKLGNIDPAYGKIKILLQGDDLKRYIKIGTTPTITCEFCCGAKTLVTQSGGPACGCEHSAAMRGLSAYLIKNYPEKSDDEIIRELAKWKGLFFPKNMVQRFLEEQKSGQFTPDIAALLIGVDKEKLNIGEDVPLPSNLKDLPGMVGGC